MHGRGRLSGRTIGIIVAIVASILTIELAAAAPVIDQQQSVIDTGRVFAVGGGSDQKLAQVVTAGRSGLLAAVRFAVACGGDLIVEIQGLTGDTPNGAVRTAQLISGAGLPPFVPPMVPEFRTLVFSTPVSISAGERFSIVLHGGGPGSSCGLSPGPSGDSYPGGDAFFDARPNPPGIWVPLGQDLAFQTLVDPVVVVSIDIKPGSVPNSINSRSHGLIPVAILSTSTFEAPAQVDDSSLTFGSTGDERSLAFCNASPEDVDFDGLLDQVCHFFTERTGFQLGDATGTLKGRTISGIPLLGTDSVRIIR